MILRKESLLSVKILEREFLIKMSLTTDLFHENYPIYLDLHTHTISSGHGSTDKIIDLVHSARDRKLKILGISDHGPATSGSASASYFRCLKYADKQKEGVRILYGTELNIVDMEGNVDLEDSVLKNLDYAFISIHPPVFTPYEHSDLTEVYMKAMNHPKVSFLGHIDDARFPVNFEKLLIVAKEKGIYPEINNGSLMPNAYRADGQKNCRILLQICKNLKLPVLLSSDSHGKKNVGNMEYIFPLLKEINFPKELIINSNEQLWNNILF